MKVYSIGPDEASDAPTEECADFLWIVYWYAVNGYEGSGESVALGLDGLLYVKDLGHCSCYGPFEDWAASCQKFTVAEYLRPKDSVHDLEVMSEVDAKVTELLNA